MTDRFLEGLTGVLLASILVIYVWTASTGAGSTLSTVVLVLAIGMAVISGVRLIVQHRAKARRTA